MKFKTCASIVPVLLSTACFLQAQVLNPVQNLFDNFGLKEASCLALSPDGRHAYACSIGRDSLSVFSRDGDSGRLEFIRRLHNDQGDTDGLIRPMRIAISPDGRHLYVISSPPKSLTALARDPATGRLTFVASFDSLLDGFPADVVVSPDGLFVYVSTTRAGVAVLRRDPGDGTLSLVETESLFSVVSVFPHQLAISPDGRNLYTFIPGLGYFAMSRNPESGELTLIQTLKNGVDGVSGLLETVESAVVSANGQQVYATGGHPGEVAVLNRDAATGLLALAQVLKDENGGVFGLGRPNSLTLSPDGAHLYVVGADDSIVVFARRADDGSLAFITALLNGVEGIRRLDFPTAVAASPDGGQIYVAARNSDSLIVFSRNESNGLLTIIQERPNLGFVIDGLELPNFIFENATSLAVSPDDQNVYLSSSGSSGVPQFSSRGSLAVFQREADSGSLRLVEVRRDDDDGLDGLRGALSIALSPKGDSLYVIGLGAAGQEDREALSVFARDPATGRLTTAQTLRREKDGIENLERLLDLEVSADGSHVYVLNGRRFVLSFSRDSEKGTLSLLGAQRFDALGLPERITLAPDGRHLYISSHSSATILGRDPSSGSLTPLGMQDIAADSRFGGRLDFVFSPDGRHAYAALISVLSLNPPFNFISRIIAFSRDAQSGDLAAQDGLLVSEEQLLTSAPIRQASLSADGSLFAMTFGDSLGLFSRHPIDGSLSLLGTVTDGSDGIGALGEPAHAQLSRDGAFAYVVGKGDGALTVFRISRARLAAEIEVSGSFGLGEIIRYRVTLTNIGNAPQMDGDTDEFVNFLPSALILLGAELSQGSGAVDVDAGRNKVTWNGSLSPGQRTVFTIEARIIDAVPGERITNQATLQFDANGDGANESVALSDDPNSSDPDDPSDFTVGQVEGIPTLSTWGAILLILSLAGWAVGRLR